MSETVIVRELSRPDVELPMDRDEFYREQVQVFKEKGAPTKAVDIIQAFIFNGNGEMLVQKRSFDKNHNPGLLDKSIGGHVKYGDTPDYTVMVETVQELQTPSIVLRDQGLFKKTKILLNDYLDTVAVIKHHGGDICEIGKVIDKKRVITACRVHLYFGLYNGRVRPIDREAKGVLWYTLEELSGEMQKFPETFTEDIHFFIKRYRAEMEEFLKTY